jgi:hypothetical protein
MVLRTLNVKYFIVYDDDASGFAGVVSTLTVL